MKAGFPIVVHIYFRNLVFILFNIWLQLASYCSWLQNCWAFPEAKVDNQEKSVIKRFTSGSQQLAQNREWMKYLRKNSITKALIWGGEAVLNSGLSPERWQKHLVLKVSTGWITKQFVKLGWLWWGHRGTDPERQAAEAGHAWNFSEVQG